jgi:tetratricopeptide (TPR) repeat protein
MAKKKVIVIVVILIIAALGVGAAVYYFSSFDYQVKKRLGGKSELLAKYEKIKTAENKNKAEGKVDLGRLFLIGMEWKGLGDLTKDKFFYTKALETYQSGMETFGEKNVLLFWNAGRVAESLEDYNLAESYYKKSIEITAGYDDPYRNLAEMYQYKMKKSPAEILAVYDAGLKAGMGSADLFLDKCSYLRSIKYNQEAVECYQLLSDNYPDNQGYKDVIKELSVEISSAASADKIK